MTVKGFDANYYLAEKLDSLQKSSDAALAKAWTDKTVADVFIAFEEAGLTPEQHYEMYGAAESLSPNAYFDAAEYTLAKAAQLMADQPETYKTVGDAKAAFLAAWDGDVYDHYLQYGAAEGINPSNDFDVSSYYTAKLADLQADEATASEWAGKTEADVAKAFNEAGLTAVEHFLAFGKDEKIVPVVVPADEQVHPIDANLTDALADLKAAETAITEFLVTADGDDNAKTTATEAQVNDAATAAKAALATAEATTTMNVLNAELQDAKDAVTAATAAVNTVKGLKAADSVVDSATTAKEAAAAEVVKADAVEAGAKAAFETYANSFATITINDDTGAVAGGGTDILVVKDGELVIADDTVTLAGKDVAIKDLQGINELLAAVKADVAADKAATAAATALTTAQDAVKTIENAHIADIKPAAETAATDAATAATAAAKVVTDLGTLNTALAEGVKAVADANTAIDDAVTAKAITADQAVAIKAVVSTDGDDANISAAEAAAVDVILDPIAASAGTAKTNADNAKTAAADYLATLVDDSNPLTSALDTAEGKVDTAEDNIEDRGDIVKAATDTQALADALKALNDTLDDAKDVFTDADQLDLTLPTVVDGSETATADNDIFVVATDDGAIANFGAVGTDVLYIGADVTLNTGDIATAGDNSVLEVFITKDGSNDAVINVETSAFGSNAATPEFASITLTGVSVDDVQLADGFITVA